MEWTTNGAEFMVAGLVLAMFYRVRLSAFSAHWFDLTLGEMTDMIRVLLRAMIGFSLCWTGTAFGTEYSILSPSDCGKYGYGLTVLVNSNAALIIKSEGATSKVALASVELVSESLVLTIEGEEGELVLPKGSLEHCESIPGLLPVLFAEAITVFKQLDPRCYGGTIDARCVAAVFDTIDVTGDGAFSRAELSRMVRAAGFFIGHRMLAEPNSVSFVPLENMYVVQLAASALGPFVADNIIESYDYDSDGSISPKELMQDRRPQEGIESAIAGIASVMAPDTLSVLMKPMAGIFDLLNFLP